MVVVGRAGVLECLLSESAAASRIHTLSLHDALPISKSMIGHTISAAGAIELATTILAVRDQIAPPTINYRVPDPECDLGYVPNTPVAGRIRAAISNSFGFGGHNDCLLVREIAP